MPIGDQEYDGQKLTEHDLKQRYNDLIKEALNKADPSLSVIRSDEISSAGSITKEVFHRIREADIVVADVTYPNPNVFYELGLRHAIKAGTIIIRDQNGPKIPFDIAHLRFIEYDNTPTGLKRLASNLKDYFEQFESDPDRPDNEMLEELGLNRSHNGKEMIKVSSPLLYALAIGHNKPESLSMQFPSTFINNSNTLCIIQDLRLILEQNNNQSNELYFANSKSSMNNHESLLAQQFAIESNRTYSAAFFFHPTFRTLGCRLNIFAAIDFHDLIIII